MKRIVLKTISGLFAAFCLLVPSQVRAQVDYSNFILNPPGEADFRGRVSVGINKKLAKGLHVALGEEVRFRDAFSSFDRSYTTLSLSYKICPYFKIQAGYGIMAVTREPDPEEESVGKWDIRHRGTFDLVGLYKIGEWHFSLRERLQGTYFTRELNPYQAPQMQLNLRSRLKVSYAFHSVPFKPYIFGEQYNTLNAVNLDKALYQEGSKLMFNDPSQVAYYNSFYGRRVRAAAGCEWTLDSHNTLDLYILADFNCERDIDATKKGKLKNITNERSTNISLGIAYTFGF